MKIGNILYFSPKHKFIDLDLEDKEKLIDAFEERVKGYYLIPAEEIVGKHVFASGVLCVSTMDYLAKLESGSEKVKERFVTWTKNNIEGLNKADPDNVSSTLAYRFYNEFRNGLVHECRIKNAGQFSFNYSELDRIIDGVMIINPKYLLNEIKKSFDRYLEIVNKDDFTLQALKCTLINDFRSDFEALNR